MSGMTDARKAVTADLQAVGLTVKDHVPEKVVPPLVLLRAGGPNMLEPGDTLDGAEMVFHLGLLILIKNKPNAEATEDLESTIEKVLWNLGDWDLDGVGQPFFAQHNGYEYPAVELSISKSITIEGGE